MKKPKLLWLQSITCNANAHSFFNHPDFFSILSNFELIHHPLLTTNYDDTTVRDVVVALINSNNRPWTAIASGSAIAFSKANVVCR